LTLANARELEFVSKIESVIQTSTKNKFTSPLMFGDIEEGTGYKVMLLHWGDVYNNIS
jgi:hypothetical protein